MDNHKGLIYHMQVKCILSITYRMHQNCRWMLWVLLEWSFRNLSYHSFFSNQNEQRQLVIWQLSKPQMIGFHFAKKESVWTRSSWSYLVKFKSNINCIRVICCMDIKKGWIEWVTSQEVISMILKVVSHLKEIMIPLPHSYMLILKLLKQLSDHQPQLWHDSKYIYI